MLTITGDRKNFYQWDVGQSLTVTPVEGETITEVHIGTNGSDDYFVVIPVGGIVAVYDELLQQGNDFIVAYEYVKTGGEGHTIRTYRFKVIGRPKADDYAYVPTESHDWGWWCERAREYAEASETNANEAERYAQDARESAEAVLDMTVSAHEDTAPNVTKTESGGVVHLEFGLVKGDKGDTGEQGIQGEQGDKGDKGDKGEQGDEGFSPTAVVSKSGDITTISITDKNGTTTAQVNDGTSFSGDYDDLTNKPTIPTASTATPLMDGTASYGSGTSYARSNHRHPKDTSKQDKLVNGTNIKTVNGNSLLGSGDITISGGLVVTLSDDATGEYTHVADKTYNQIYTAIMQGQSVSVVFDPDSILPFADYIPVMMGVAVEEVIEKSGDTYYFYFCMYDREEMGGTGKWYECYLEATSMNMPMHGDIFLPF